MKLDLVLGEVLELGRRKDGGCATVKRNMRRQELLFQKDKRETRQEYLDRLRRTATRLSAPRVASCPRACVAAPSAERTELSAACVSIARRHRHTAREQRARIARSRSRAAKRDMVTAVALAAVAARAADARSA